MRILWDKKSPTSPLFTIKDGTSKRYRIYYSPGEAALSDQPLIAKLDFATLKFIANDARKRNGFDEICLHNDTSYDVMVSHSKCMVDDCVADENYHKSNAITIEPGTIFHKTVHCPQGKAGNIRLRSLGLLVISITTMENGGLYSLSYPRRVYTHSSLVGTKGWKSVQVSVETIRWFNQGFSVSCN